MPTPQTSVLPSSCPLDCPDSCSLEITVDDGRVTKIDAAPRNPLTSGFICSKVRRFTRHLYGQERLLRPAVRRGAKGAGDFAPVSWDEALNLIAGKMRRLADRNGEAILPLSYGGSNGFLTQDTTDARLFRGLGASRLARTVCAQPTRSAAVGLYGAMPGVAFEDYVHAELIVVWGANPSASGIHLVPIVQQARERGTRLVVVDPRATPLAKKADLHLAPRPGTDLPLAMAIHRLLFAENLADRDFLDRHTTGWQELERRADPWTLDRAAEISGVDAEAIASFTRLYAESDPAVVRCGWGQERNRNGGSATAAILALPAVAGKFGRRGGGYTMSNSKAWTFDTAALIDVPLPATREINMNRVGAVLLDADPAVELLFVYNCNPLVTLPEQEKVRRGLEREDLFTVVFDQVMTDTARYADVVLPATTFLEHRELARGYGAMVLHDIEPVIEPVGEARSNPRVFADLCRRVGLERPGQATSADEMVDALLASSGREDELRRQLAEDGIGHPAHGSFPVQLVDVQPATSDGKIHLVPESLDREAPEGLYTYLDDPGSERFPLALISPATSRTISSTFGQLHRRQVSVELHPDDALARGISNGDRVRVFNQLGEVLCRAAVSRDLRPGVALLPKGLWCHNTENGATSNALAPDTLADLGGGACFNDARVEVEKR